MYKYKRSIYWSDKDAKFIVEVPELPGCMSDGESPIGVLENVEPIMTEWIETGKEIGREVPELKGK